MATKTNGLDVVKAKTQALELSGHVPEVTQTEYRSFTDEALDGEIVESFGAAQEHYMGLRREVVMRLLPALAEMRNRHAAQGSRNDLNTRLGLPRRAGWEDYLRSRGLKPDTVRNWFQKQAAASKILGLLGSGETPEGAAGAQQDINVIASELIRDIESRTRQEKLEAVLQSHRRVNPTILKKLILALKNASRDSASFEANLSKVYQEFPRDGKCHQRAIRERLAELPEEDIEEKTRLAASFENAEVRGISLDEARAAVMAQEYLGNLGAAEHAFGLYFGKYLAGVVAFGSTLAQE